MSNLNSPGAASAFVFEMLTTGEEPAELEKLTIGVFKVIWPRLPVACVALRVMPPSEDESEEER